MQNGRPSFFMFCLCCFFKLQCTSKSFEENLYSLSLFLVLFFFFLFVTIIWKEEIRAKIRLRVVCTICHIICILLHEQKDVDVDPPSHQFSSTTITLETMRDPSLLPSTQTTMFWGLVSCNKTEKSYACKSGKALHCISVELRFILFCLYWHHLLQVLSFSAAFEENKYVRFRQKLLAMYNMY